MSDYKYIDTSAAFDAREDEDFAYFLQFGNAELKNRDAFKRSGVAKGVRDNNLEMVKEYLLSMDQPEFSREILQAAARGYDDIFCFLAQQNIQPHVAASALEAAAYYGRAVCVKSIIPYCLDSFEHWKIDRGIEAALEGGKNNILPLLLPHAKMKKNSSCVLRGVLERDNYEAADILFDYITVSAAISDIKKHATNERVKPMLEWIQQKLADKKLQQTLQTTVDNVAETKKSKRGARPRKL